MEQGGFDQRPEALKSASYLPATPSVRETPQGPPSVKVSEDLRISEEASNDKRVVSSPEGGSEEG